MSTETVGLIGIGILVVLLFARMWIGMAMLVIGLVGYAYLIDWGRGFSIAGSVPYSTIAFYPISALPLFILMGIVLSDSGVSTDLYNTAHKWFGQFRGGLAIATVVACAALAAIMGNSVAEAVTMGKVAVPEMRKYKYDDSLSSASVAAGGTLGILIPPSMGFILYGILTEQSVGALFLAGILPGLLLTGLYVLAVLFIVARHPEKAPPGPKPPFREKMVSLKYTWHTIALFTLVLGGIYGGIFTPTEAGAIGAFGAIVIAFISRKLTLKTLFGSLRETTQSTGMVIVMIVGAFVFMKFLAVSRLTFEMAEWISALTLSPYVIFAGIVVLYIILGMFLDIMACIILTIPVIYPIILALGFDPIWYGVVMVMIAEMGMITPPVGIIVFALAGVTDVPLYTIFRGVVP
ncbi:TRAP transporter large permease, partial [Chloroflexota bacterium]